MADFTRKSWWEVLCGKCDALVKKGKHGLPQECVFCWRLNNNVAYERLIKAGRKRV